MIKPEIMDPIIRTALKEDVGSKDITTSAIVPRNLVIKADIEFKQRGVLCGLEIAERVFRIVDQDLRFLPCAKDGEMIEPKREVAYIEGRAQSILIAERTALNIISHLSGIATKTRQFVDKVKDTKVRIMDTRKTTPGLRLLEKYAVHIGGGVNHRVGLFDQVLIKDNHLRILRNTSIPAITETVRKSVLKKTVIGLEVKNLKELEEALKTKISYILLDNMTPSEVAKAVQMRNESKTKIALEVSGGVNIDTVLEYAKTGVERISIGGLTHSVPAIDVSLDIVG